MILVVSSIKLFAQDNGGYKNREGMNGSYQHKTDTSVANHGMMDTTKNSMKKPFEINYGKEIFSHLHNKLVHFPFALAVLAFIFTLFAMKWQGFEFSVKYIVLIAAIFAIPVILTGLNQAGHFTGRPKEWVVYIHKVLGLISLVLLWVWYIFLVRKPLQRFAWIVGLITTLIVTITGFYGGIVAG